MIWTYHSYGRRGDYTIVKVYGDVWIALFNLATVLAGNVSLEEAQRICEEYDKSGEDFFEYCLEGPCPNLEGCGGRPGEKCRRYDRKTGGKGQCSTPNSAG